MKKREYPNIAKIKFVVGASRSLLPASEQDAHTTKKNKFTHLGCSRKKYSFISNYQLPITNYQLPITNYQLPMNYVASFSE